MWSMANPAITEHVFNAPVPVISEFNLDNEIELEKYNSQNLSFQRLQILLDHTWEHMDFLRCYLH